MTYQKFFIKKAHMIFSIIQKRRSIRKFRNKTVDKKKIELLTQAVLMSPSSRDRKPWEFIFVTDRESLDKLSRAKQHGSAHLSNAPLGIVICADSNKSDVWVEDASIAAAFLQLAAESEGLTSCWIQIRKRMHNDNKTAQEYVSELLNIPEKLKVLCILAVGYPDEIKSPHRKEDLQFDKVYQEVYGKAP
jgi:nitroreductase